MELMSLKIRNPGAPPAQGLPPIQGEVVVAASGGGAAGPKWKRPRVEGSASSSITSSSSSRGGSGGTAADLRARKAAAAAAAAALVATTAAARELAHPTRPLHSGQPPLPLPPPAAPTIVTAPAAAAVASMEQGQRQKQKQGGKQEGSPERYHLKSRAQTTALREAFLAWGGTTTTQPPALVDAFCAKWGLGRHEVSSHFSNIRRSKWLRERQQVNHQHLTTCSSPRSSSSSSTSGGEGKAPDPTLLMPSSQQLGWQDGQPGLWQPLKRWRNARGSNCAVCRKHKKRCDGTQLGCLKRAGGRETGSGPVAQRPEEGGVEGHLTPSPRKARRTAYTTKTPAQTSALRDAFAKWGGTIKDQPLEALDAFCLQFGLTKKEIQCHFSYLRKSKPPPPPPPLQQAAAPPATAAPYLSSFGGGAGGGGGCGSSGGVATAPWTGGTDYWYGSSGRPDGGGVSR